MKKKTTFTKRLCPLLAALLLVASIGSPSALALQESPLKDLQVPTDLGIVQTAQEGEGPVIFHIQTAHGNYEAQKKIQALLHYLSKTYGIRTVFVEGSASKLDPGLLRFVPGGRRLTLQIADSLAKKSLVKGVELFLLGKPTAEAYGIENLEAYIRNGKAFQAVLVKQEKYKVFLDDLNHQIESLSAPYLNRSLKTFLKRLNDFETKKVIALSDWLAYLAREAKTVLRIDFNDTQNQIEWPMFSRVHRIQQYPMTRDEGSFHKETGEFLAKTQAWAKNELDQKVLGKIRHFLALPFSKNPALDPALSLILVKMLSFLPASFDFNTFPRVKQFFAKAVFESELSAASLSREMDLLTELISSHLAVTEVERTLLRLLKNYRLMQRLFSLDLTPEDFDLLMNPQTQVNFRPKEILRQFQSLDKENRMHGSQIPPSEMEKVESLFDLAVIFYEGARVRDRYMLPNIEIKLAKMQMNKAIVITGGFHAGAFREYFKNQGYSYALIAPKFAHREGREAYVQAAFRKGLNFVHTSTWEEPFLSDPTLQRNPELMAQIESEALLDQTLNITGLHKNYPEAEELDDYTFLQEAQNPAQRKVTQEEIRLAREVLDGMITLSSLGKMRLHKKSEQVARFVSEVSSDDSSPIPPSPFTNIN